VEDGPRPRIPTRPVHRASRRRTSQGRSTSASVVRSLPTARRSTELPFRRVCEMKTSPEPFTRSSNAWLSWSDPLRRKQTTENGRGAHSSQPGSSRPRGPARMAGRRRDAFDDFSVELLEVEELDGQVLASMRHRDGPRGLPGVRPPHGWRHRLEADGLEERRRLRHLARAKRRRALAASSPPQ
jgi:hypothetical protein